MEKNSQGDSKDFNTQLAEITNRMQKETEQANLKCTNLEQQVQELKVSINLNQGLTV